MMTFLLIIYVIICILLLIAVLLQSGKGGSVTNLFGGSGSDMFFGATGTNKFLNRVTIVLGTLFFILSLILATMSKGQSYSSSIMKKVQNPVKKEKTIPAQENKNLPMPKKNTNNNSQLPIQKNKTEQNTQPNTK